MRIGILLSFLDFVLDTLAARAKMSHGILGLGPAKGREDSGVGNGIGDI